MTEKTITTDDNKNKQDDYKRVFLLPCFHGILFQGLLRVSHVEPMTEQTHVLNRQPHLDDENKEGKITFSLMAEPREP